MILAEDHQKHGVTVDEEGRVLPDVPAAAPQENVTKKTAPTKKSNRSAFLARTQATAVATVVSNTPTEASSLATLARAERIPSAMERACDPQDLQAIRDVYGSRAQVCLTYDVTLHHFSLQK